MYEVENTNPEQHAKWMAKHGFVPDENGMFHVEQFEGKLPCTRDQLFENIRANVSAGHYDSLEHLAYDDRTFVMICGGPSIAEHLDEIRAKSERPDEYLVVCSNQTAKYLLEHGIVPHVHFIIDPQKKKMFDLSVTDHRVEYWLNVACHPAVFETLKAKGITPRAFLCDFDADGGAIKTIRENLPPGKAPMMVVQGGTMAGLRAINIADGRGFRKIEYYGFDATVRLGDGTAQAYAYDKKRGEAIIEVTCDRCAARFDTTLVFQRQVNEFLSWRQNMPWIDIEIIGGGLIDHYNEHYKADILARPYATHRYTQAYKAMQKELHSAGEYGIAGQEYAATVFHLTSQIAKRLGSCSILDYGAAQGLTMKAVRQSFMLHESITDRCYDPFVEGIDNDPAPADVVICTDVLEHVEPECTFAVLDHIAALTERVAFFSISLVPAVKVLSDGRNAHINLRPQEFWLRELNKRFIVAEAKSRGDVLLVVGQAISDVRQVLKERKAA